MNRSSKGSVTILLPCLNENETLEICIRKSFASIKSANIHGNVLIADNGSTDGSRELALKLGAEVIDVPVKGYGAALLAGIGATQSEWIIMGDADDSYALDDLHLFISKLDEGFDLVMGNRFQGGGWPLALCLGFTSILVTRFLAGWVGFFLKFQSEIFIVV